MPNSDAHGTAGLHFPSFLSGLALSLTLAVATLPSPASAALQASAASANSVTLTWTAPGDDGTFGTASRYDVRYALSPITDASWNLAIQAIGEPAPQAAGATENFTVTGLASGTTYYFAIKTADEVPNWSALSNVVSRATDAESIPPAQVTDLAADNATASSIRLTWTAPGDDSMSGTASQYDIRYATSLAVLTAWNTATPVTGEPAPAAAGTVQSFTINGLSSSTTYYFGIKTADEVPNWSVLSNTPSLATTAEQVAPAAIANLTTLFPTQNSLTLVWTAPGDDGNIGTASQYDIRYSTSNITNGTWKSATQVSGAPAPSPAGTPESLTVSGLNDNTTYYFAIKTADEVPNWSDLSNIASGVTSADQIPPSTINDLQASAGQVDGTIDLTWTAPGDDGLLGTVTTYEIRYAPDSLTEANWDSATVSAFPPTPVASGLPQTATLADLTPGSVYYVAIKAYDDAGNASAISDCDSAFAAYDISSGNNGNDNANPHKYELKQNRPNPFNPTTTIAITLPQTTEASLIVYNSMGQQVTTLLQGTLSAGEHFVEWDGTDYRGHHVATGIYYYRLAARDYVETKKMMLLK